MITPRQTRLVRVADLHAFRRAIVSLSGDDDDPAVLVVVPTRGAARQIEGTAPRFVTREELYDDLCARLSPQPVRPTPFEREAIVYAAAREAAAQAAPPFRLRPGLVAEIVRFYDQLRRQGQNVARFEEILTESLERDVDLDRGAERMLAQTRFLAAVYRAYEARLAEASLVDEDGLRELLIRKPAADPARRIVITIGDWIADPNGLYRADFDLLARLPGLERLDVIATAELGFDQRLHEWLPGIEDVDAQALGIDVESTAPELLIPAGSNEPRPFVVRDREEELIAIARRCQAEQWPLDRVGVVFKRPLPYLYLASEVFGGASIAYRAFDTLPLAAEPFAAALDLVLELVASQFTRASIVALLRSPQFQFDRGREPATREDIAALDRSLVDAHYFGGLERLRALGDELPAGARAKSVLSLAIAAADELQPLLTKGPASTQLSRLLAFLTSFTRPPQTDRDRRAQAGIFGILQAMSATHAAYDDREATIDGIAPDIRRWVGEATFAPETADHGVRLLDAQAARYGELDHVFVVGLVEAEWPERPRRNIFYPPALLATLGWPTERERRGAERAAFVDLLRSANKCVALSTFTLDDEALVEPSSFVDEIAGAKLRVVEVEPPPPAIPAALDDRARAWAELRLSRTAASEVRYHGDAGPQAPRPWSVGAIETYLSCPFKFFARYVLGLEEEPNDDEVMDPKQQGRFVHEVFERFFAEWQARGHRAITPANLEIARALFAEIVEDRVARLPDAEAAIERTRLLGSSVAPGLAEVVFRMEAERPIEVVERLLEHRFDDEFVFTGPDGARRIRLRGVADRIDLLADGTIRLIDYKLSSAPQKSRALQLPIYGLCAEQHLRDHEGRRWTLGEAAYIALRGARRIVPLFTARADRDEVLRAAEEKLVAAIDGIERGAFPPTPDDVFLCGFCSYASVCRKDYVGDV